MDAISPVAPDESALLDRVLQGDGAVAATIMQSHNRALWRIARGILGDDAEAEDVVQETYLRGFSAIGSFRGESSLGTWLAHIAVNEAMRRLGRRRPTVDLADLADTLATDQLVQPTATSADPEQVAARAEIRHMIERAIDTLAPPFRAVFMMRIVEQMSIKETADSLDITVATAKTRLHRANQQLRATLGGEFATAFDDAFPFAGARCDRLVQAVLSRLGGRFRASKPVVEAYGPLKRLA